MPVDLPLRCQCGQVRGVASVSPSSGMRVLCYCKDCQAFARFLERQGALDPAGGTDIFQMPPARLRLTAGAEAMRCLRLSDKGILRWYAACCHTPIANTAGPRIPVVGVIHSFMDHATDGRSRDAVLGPPLCVIFQQSAVGPLPSTAPPPPSFGVFVRRAAKMLSWSLGGLAHPNPFFEAATGAPRSAPRAVTASERASVYR